MTKSRSLWVIVLSLLFAGVLAVLPLPNWLSVWRPDWVTLVMVYWAIALPHRVGLLSAWIVGFLVDVLKGTLLGLNAGVLSLIVYAALSGYQRLRMFTPIQQSLTLLLLIGGGQLLMFWVLTATGKNTADPLSFAITALASALMWPLIFVWLRFWRRAFRVN
jgi:rod shape-determining protein MreD